MIKSISLLAGTWLILMSCQPEIEGAEHKKSELLLFQFDGQNVRVEICGEVVVDNIITTPQNADGLSSKYRFENGGDCHIKVKIGEQFDYQDYLKEDTRYISLTYNLNEYYADLSNCKDDCEEYTVEQHRSYPLTD